VHALVGGRPLEGIEEAVVAEFHAAVQSVLRASGKPGGGRVEVVPHPALAERGQRGESVVREHASKDARARCVELQDREHD
jgi:hypothetical protein